MAPAVALGISAAAWSDPVLGPRLETGLEEVKPLVQAVRDGAPVMEVLSGATAQAGLAARASRKADAADAIPPEQSQLRSSMDADLPTSVVPVNRPGGASPSGD
jgi:hypothetical protein